MNINKKLDRVKQWAGEKMGQETKTDISDDVKAWEAEMTLRHEGMEKLHKSMNSYVKSLSKRQEGEDKEKTLPGALLGQIMINHGEDFEPDSEFGNCLIGMGRANDRIARHQETYVVNATNGWLESIERSLTMMKEYQSARKKLDTRRLAFDTSLGKIEKAKKEDFRLEEELRSQKVKYAETNEDVIRRMEDIKEAEAESVADLGAFLDAELEYYDKCRDELLQLKRNWPAGQTSSPQREQRRPAQRSRANTARSYTERYAAYDEPQMPEPEPVKLSIRSQGRVQSSSRNETRQNTHDDYPQVESPPRPTYGRASTFQGPTSINRATTPVGGRKASIPTDIGNYRNTLRPTQRLNTLNTDVFGDPSDDSTLNSGSPDRSYTERSVSPATSYGSAVSRTASYSTLSNATNGRKAPPPPPSRAKKPPPPPPMKRADMSSASVGRY